MIRILFFSTVILIITCKSIDKTADCLAINKDVLSDYMVIDSNRIKNFISKDCIYSTFFLTDLDNDTVSELIIVSKSLEKSDCLSSMFDSACNYLVTDVYKKKNNEWSILLNYKLPDFESTFFSFDSLSNLVVTKYTTPSGLSKQEEIKTYKFLNDDFYLKKICLSIDTKLSSAFGISSDNWEYIIDLRTKDVDIKYTTLRLEKDENNESFLKTTDTILHRELVKNFSIKLSEEYELDTIVGKENMIFYY